jgi:general secretion pathway protein L
VQSRIRLDRAALDAEALINRQLGPDIRRMCSGYAKTRRKRDRLTTLYIRHPARAEGEGALARFALVADGGAMVQQGEGALRGMGDLVAASRRVVLLLAAADVTLLHVKAPPLSGARLKAALPAWSKNRCWATRPIACWWPRRCCADGLRSGRRGPARLARAAGQGLLAHGRARGGRRARAAVPAAAAGQRQRRHRRWPDITLRHGQYQASAWRWTARPKWRCRTRARAGRRRAADPVRAAAQLGEYQALAQEAGPGITLEADAVGTLDRRLENHHARPGAGPRRGRRPPARLAALALADAPGAAGVVVNLIGLNIEWLRLKREADAMRQAMLQTFRSAYPKEPSSIDPVAQMRQNIARAKAASGQVGPDEFGCTWPPPSAKRCAACRARPAIASMDFRERALTVKVKPESLDPGCTGQLRALARAT